MRPRFTIADWLRLTFLVGLGSASWHYAPCQLLTVGSMLLLLQMPTLMVLGLVGVIDAGENIAALGRAICIAVALSCGGALIVALLW